MTAARTDGTISPDKAGFRALAATPRRVIPVTRRLLADGETPIGIYRKLAERRPGTFLLESAEHGGVWSRYSFIGARSAAILTERDGQAGWIGTPPAGVPPDGDPLDVLRATVEALHSPPLPGLPPLTGGLVGYLGYDVVRRFERLPVHAVDELALPELGFMLSLDLAVLDHADGSVLLIANAINDYLVEANDEARIEAGTGAGVDEAYDDAVRRLEAMTQSLASPAPSTVATLTRAGLPSYSSRTPEGDYPRAVRHLKAEIEAGEAFQVVPSQRFEMDTDADPLDVYRVLRTSNPSPYMYLLRFPGPEGGAEGGYDVVGSSPEAHVKISAGRALLHPIAGTRWRGETPEEDARLAAELLEDPKERSEHVMLVDLGRNDLGRVCAPGTVDVVEFMAVERYSHVMHIVSTVVGDLAPGRSAYDVLAATFPAGTLTGAPKVRAMELIEEVEPVRRGLYGGTVGYLDFAGDLDMAIAIRTALMRDGKAYVQAGGGVVADSDPAAEEQESRNKAAAVLTAITVARSLCPAGTAPSPHMEDAARP